MSFDSFLADAQAVRDRGDWLVELTVPGPSGDEVLRFSRRGTSTISAVTIGSDSIPAHTPYRRRLLVAPTMMQALWKARTILGRSIPSFGGIELQNADGGLDRYRPSAGYRWLSGRGKVFFCDTTDIQNTIGKVFDGRIGKPDFAPGMPVKVPFFGREADFELLTSERVYRGTRYCLELFGDRTVSFGSPAATNLTGAMTAEGWVYLHDLAAANLQYWGYVGGTRVPWRIDIQSSGALRFAYTHSSGTGVGHITAKLLVAKRWYHISFVVSGTVLTIRIWDEDAQVLTTEVFSTASATRDAQVGGSYVLRSGSDASARPWIDDARVWAGARTASEIAAGRKGPLTTVPALCVHYAKYDDGSGTSVTDSSASAITGSISGAGTSTWLWVGEGDESLAGRPKPEVWGETIVAPVLVDPIRFIYQVAGGGAVQSIVSDEGGIAHTMDANAASLRALLTTAPMAGHSLPFLTRGLFRLGSSPTLPISALVQGYNGGTVGYANAAGTITRKLVTERGPLLADPGDLDTASFTAYAAASSAKMGLFLAQPQPIGQALDTINAGAAGWYGFVRASPLFHVERFAGPAVTADYDFDGRQIVEVIPASPPAVVYEVVIRFAFNPVVLSEDQAAAAFKGTIGWQARRQDWQEERRTDDDLRALYPGAAGQSVSIETALQTRADAAALADYLLLLLKGEKEGWIVRLRATGLQVKVGQTLTLDFTLQDGTQRSGLNGTRKFVVLSTEDVKQREEVKVEVWG